MPASYQVFALTISVLLLPAFAQIYRRVRDARTLLWLLGLSLAVVYQIEQFPLGSWRMADPRVHPWMVAAGQTAILLSAVLFLASLSPLSFRIGRMRVLYVIPFGLPLVAFSILLFGVFHGATPAGMPFLLFPALAGFSLLAGCLWAFQKQTMPRWISLALCIVLGGAGFRIYVTYGGVWALQFVECAAHIVTALLVLYVFRRISAGTVLTSLGFLAWSSRFFLLSPALTVRPMLDHALHNLIALGVIVAAVGLIMIAFESQAAAHQAGRDREARARKEIEAYTRLNLTIRRVEDLDHQAVEICRTVVDHSCFRQSALLLIQNPGRFQLAGTAGFDDAAVNSLEAAAPRIPTDGLLALGTAEPVVPHAQTFPLHLESWLQPGDDIERLRLGEVLAVPLQGRSSFEGILLLAARRNPEDSLHAQDLLPAELLAARIQVARDRALMLEKLVDSEKFASLGQLSGSVTRQLNNPLTVILGYASMLEESTDLTPQMRKAIDAMVNEARSMRSTVDSLARMSHAQAGQIAAVSISELLSDMEQLHRTEFLHRSINFRLNVQPSMPLVHGNPQQIRQAVLYCIQFAIEAVESLDPSSDRAIRVDAAVHDGSVRVTIAHSGPSFVHPARAFDPFVPTPSGGETAGLGLSLCATILRENRGRITAINNEPRGAAIVLDLQAA